MECITYNILIDMVAGYNPLSWLAFYDYERHNDQM